MKNFKRQMDDKEDMIFRLQQDLSKLQSISPFSTFQRTLEDTLPKHSVSNDMLVFY